MFVHPLLALALTLPAAATSVTEQLQTLPELDGWCAGPDEVLLTGDFRGDGYTDLLCHDALTGVDRIGQFSALGYVGDKVASDPWCAGTDRELVLGDLDGDGRTDRVCHDPTNSVQSLSFTEADGWFHGTDADHVWCDADLRTGQFDAYGGDDLLCHADDGTWTVSLAYEGGIFLGTDYGSRGAGWCTAEGAELFIGDFDFGGVDDLLCWHRITGLTEIDFGEQDGYPRPPEWDFAGYGSLEQIPVFDGFGSNGEPVDPYAGFDPDDANGFDLWEVPTWDGFGSDPDDLEPYEGFGAEWISPVGGKALGLEGFADWSAPWCGGKSAEPLFGSFTVKYTPATSYLLDAVCRDTRYGFQRYAFSRPGQIFHFQTLEAMYTDPCGEVGATGQLVVGNFVADRHGTTGRDEMLCVAPNRGTTMWGVAGTFDGFVEQWECDQTLESLERRVGWMLEIQAEGCFTPDWMAALSELAAADLVEAAQTCSAYGSSITDDWVGTVEAYRASIAAIPDSCWAPPPLAEVEVSCPLYHTETSQIRECSVVYEEVNVVEGYTRVCENNGAKQACLRQLAGSWSKGEWYVGGSLLGVSVGNGTTHVTVRCAIDTGELPPHVISTHSSGLCL